MHSPPFFFAIQPKNCIWDYKKLTAYKLFFFSSWLIAFYFILFRRPSSSKELAVMETIDFLLLMLPRINGQEENGQEKENGRFGWDGLFSCANGDAAVTNGGNGYHQLKRVGWCMKKRRTQTSKTLFKFWISLGKDMRPRFFRWLGFHPPNVC